MYLDLHEKYPLLLSYFSGNWGFSTDSCKLLISKFMKILPMEAELFYADGQTGTTKLIVAFRNFANAPIGTYLLCIKLQIWR